MLPNTEDIQRLLEFVRANIAGVVIGVLIGGGVVSWAYETFLLKSTKLQLETLTEKYNDLAAVKNPTTTSSASSKIGQSTAVSATVDGQLIEVKKGTSEFFTLPDGVVESISVGAIYDIHSYLYAGVQGDQRQLYIGESVGFKGDNYECIITLVGISKPFQTGKFRIKCK